ncbi:MFS transporter [Cryobacterium psychrophilum]|uniref:MFS transporter n=1 Tax=Cryobacterium psychrophilum TaxID=41988 RepID=A0A4Y8KLH3_9MICO|nr:MFS transporter [Cryobacterium psychrophilum]TDW26980.1 putative MFS family arabinose efflux permease [Cryobacterium psychrophilum]TFD75293.1 MFS transporter [Cryobacterium psychrophilum]
MSIIQKESPAPARAGNRPHLQMLLSASLVTAVFALSNSPTPLYVRWQAQLGFSDGILTLIFAAYIAGLLLTLLVAGQLADRFGRKPVIIPGLALAIVASVLFAVADSVTILVIARFLTGISVGVIVSAGIAAVVDVGGSTRRRQASLAASVAMVLGAGLGPLLGGLFAQVLAAPIVPLFLTELVILAAALGVAIVLPLKQHHVRASEAAPGRRTWRLPGVPREYRMHVALGIAVFAPGITATSFVLSLGPSLLSTLLHLTSPLIAGGMACAMFLAATGVQFAVGRLQVRTIFILGSVATIASMFSLAVAVNASLSGFLIAAALLAGAGQGLGQLGGLTLIGAHVPGHLRAEANSVLNIGGYIPAGVIPVATGFLVDAIGLARGASVFAIVLVAAGATALVFVHRRLERD